MQGHACESIKMFQSFYIRQNFNHSLGPQYSTALVLRRPSDDIQNLNDTESKTFPLYQNFSLAYPIPFKKLEKF